MGLATATALAESGVTRLVLVDLNLDSLQTAEAAIAEAARARGHAVQTELVAANLAEEVACNRAVEQAFSRFGRVDVCVNCAGINQRPRGLTHELDVLTLDGLHAVNMRGLWMTQRAQLRAMLKQEPLPTRPSDVGLRGAIVNISSNSAFAPLANIGAYASGKAGVVGLCHVDGKAYADQGIRVNGIALGVIATGMNVSSRAAGETFSTMLERTPAGRIGKAAKIAQAALFLCHPLTTCIHGQTLTVDGGYSLA
ncbi:hypothetical protein JCM10207_003159 [Rhodosporidiobolus poonsookiae]